MSSKECLEWIERRMAEGCRIEIESEPHPPIAPGVLIRVTLTWPSGNYQFGRAPIGVLAISNCADAGVEME